MSIPASSSLVLIIATPTTGKIIEVTVNREGIQAMRFERAQEAFAALKTPLPVAPALVFLDLSPSCLGDSGYGVIRVLRCYPAFQHSSFVALDSQTTIFGRLRARIAGVTVYLPKPITTQQIVELVNHSLSGQ